MPKHIETRVDQNVTIMHVAFVVEGGVLQEISLHHELADAEAALADLLGVDVAELEDELEERNEGEEHVGIWEIEVKE